MGQSKLARSMGDEDDLRHAFLQHLPLRLDVLLRRIARLQRDGWDINALKSMHDELEGLGRACRPYGLAALGEAVDTLAATLGTMLESRHLHASEDALKQQSTRVRTLSPIATANLQSQPHVNMRRYDDSGFALLEMPPDDLWRVLGAPELERDNPSGQEHFTPTQDMGSWRVLIASHEPALAGSAATILRAAGAQVHALEEPLAVLDALPRLRPQLVLLDLSVPAYDGPELAAMIHQRVGFEQLPVLYLSPTEVTGVRAQLPVLCAPLTPDGLIEAAHRQLSG